MVATQIDWTSPRNVLEGKPKKDNPDRYEGKVYFEETKYKFSLKITKKAKKYKVRGRVYEVDESGMIAKKIGQDRDKIIKNYAVTLLRTVLEPVIINHLAQDNINDIVEGKEFKTRKIQGITVDNDNLIESVLHITDEELKDSILSDIKKHHEIQDDNKNLITDERLKQLFSILKDRCDIDVIALVDKGIPQNDQMFDIASDVYVKSTEEEEIKTVLSRRIVELHSKNHTTTRTDLQTRAQPQYITPQLAATLYGKAFISNTSKTKKPTTIDKYYNSLKKICNLLSVIPMSQFSERKIADEIKKNKIKDSQLKRLLDFWSFCIVTGKCTGNNPVKKPEKKRVSADSRRAQAERVAFLNLSQQDAFYEYLLTHHNRYTLALALAFASGLGFKDVSYKTCGDLVFEENGTIVLKHFIKEFGYTQNYTAPICPNAYEVIKKEYSIIQDKYPDRFDKIYIMKQNTRNEPVNYELLREEAKRVFYKIGLEDDSFKAARSIGTEKSAAGTILTNTMKYNLDDICNLSDEDGTVRFLMKRSLAGNVTADNYVSYVSPEGRARLAGILRCLRKNKKNEKRYEKLLNDDELKMEIYKPESMRSYLRVSGYITIPPKTEIIIKCDHGVEGTIEPVRE